MADNPDSSELECKERQMEPGDALYLPKGVVHAAQTDEAAPAAHLTISVPMRGRTWGDLLTHAANAVAAESRPTSERCVVRAAFHHATCCKNIGSTLFRNLVQKLSRYA